MKRLNLFKYGLTALMMAFAMTLCFSCSKDDDEETNYEVNPPSYGEDQINAHAYVELAGIKWATENVGAVSRVWAIGTDSTYGYYYNQDLAKSAAESWGSKWTLPSEDQWKALLNTDNCTWTWKTDYSFCGKTMNGYLVTDNKNGNSIFLPAAGIFNDGLSIVYEQSNYGSYWSTDFQRYLFFRKGDCSVSNGYPSRGMAVRPVVKEVPASE